MGILVAEVVAVMRGLNRAASTSVSSVDTLVFDSVFIIPRKAADINMAGILCLGARIRMLYVDHVLGQVSSFDVQSNVIRFG